MKHCLALVLLFLVSSFCYSQNTQLFKKVKQSDYLKIICLTDHLDSLQINNKFSFFCEKPEEVKDVLSTFFVGDKTRQIGEGNEMHIFLLRNKEIQPGQILINPRYSNVNTNVLGNFEYYTFDTIQLTNSHKKYPVNYTCKRITFDSKKEFDFFLSVHKNDSSLLCFQNWTQPYAGTGIITIKKDKVVKDGFKGEDYLDAILKKLVSNENDYSIGFIPKEFNNDIYTFEVDCSKEVFDKIQDERCQKQGWTMSKFELLTYWRK